LLSDVLQCHLLFFFFNHPATTPPYTLSLHDALPISYRVVLVGAGRIGSALVQYPGFRQRGFHVAAIYDKDPKKIGSRWNGSRDIDRKSTRLNSSHVAISYAVFCLKKKKTI